MDKFNLGMINIFEKFNYGQFPIQKLEIWLNKLKFEENLSTEK